MTDTKFSPAQAQYLVERLVADKVVSASTLRRMAREMEDEVKALERRLALLKGAITSSSSGGNPKRRRAVLSTSGAASRRLQGQYLGLIRQIPASQRGTFKKIAADKGREQAVRALRQALAARAR
jgi:O6-methylguanine-DNA--protein-cysteine methyltransferase